jgi:glycerate 2-kinase
MAAALGVLFLDGDHIPIDPLPTQLCNVKHVDVGSRMVLPEITAACDVDNPLLGPRGATAVFSKQKGAGTDDQNLLEKALANLVRVTGGEYAAITAGAGAAGGLGFGLLHFAGAGLVSGFDLLAGLLNLEKRISMADHVITGEGSIDHQSLSGKGPVAIARMARDLGKPVTAFCGQADDEARNSGIFQSIHALADTGLPIETLIQEAAALLTRLVAECAADLTKS